jgi:hypothetical protein
MTYVIRMMMSPNERLIVQEAAEDRLHLPRPLTRLQRRGVEAREHLAVGEEGVRERNPRDELVAHVLEDRLEARVLLPLEEDVEPGDDRQARLQKGHELLIEDEELPGLHLAPAERKEARERQPATGGLPRRREAAGRLHREEARALPRQLAPQRGLVGSFQRAHGDRAVGASDATDERGHQVVLSIQKIPGPGPGRQLAEKTRKSAPEADSSFPTPRM